MKGFVNSREFGVAMNVRRLFARRLVVIMTVLGAVGFTKTASAIDLDDGFDSASVRSVRGAGPARLYSGGKDEGDLEVQESLPVPVRSISAIGGVPQPTSQSESDESASGETTSND